MADTDHIYEDANLKRMLAMKPQPHKSKVPRVRKPQNDASPDGGV